MQLPKAYLLPFTTTNQYGDSQIMMGPTIPHSCVLGLGASVTSFPKIVSVEDLSN